MLEFYEVVVVIRGTTRVFAARCEVHRSWFLHPAKFNAS